MPDPTSTDNENPVDTPEPAPGKPSNLAKLGMLAFLVVVIAAECLVAYLCLPSANETAAMAEATVVREVRKDDEPAKKQGQPEQQPPSDQVEVDLGEFSVTAFQPVSSSTLRIDFHLFGTVAAEGETEFVTLMEENLHRFREQVIVTVRSADITDLTDAGLGLIKRKILEKTNKTLGKPLLRAVIFSDFSFIEQ